jgi:hypothetical protein
MALETPGTSRELTVALAEGSSITRRQPGEHAGVIAVTRTCTGAAATMSGL